MDRFKAQDKSIKHRLVEELGKAWIETSMDPVLIARGRPLVGEVALQTSLFIYGLIATGSPDKTGFSDKEMAARCSRFGICWTRCTGENDVYRCVQWAIALQDEVTRCNALSCAA